MDFDKNSGLAFAKMFKAHQINIELEAFLEVYQPINFQYWKWYREDMVTKNNCVMGDLKRVLMHLISRLMTDR